MATGNLALKVVAVITTTRTAAFLRSRIEALLPAARDRIAAALGAEFSSASFEWKVSVNAIAPGRFEIYPRLWLSWDTGLEDTEVRRRLNAATASLRDDLEAQLAGASNITVERVVVRSL